MPTTTAFALKSFAAAVLTAGVLSFSAQTAGASVIDGESGLRQSIGFLSLVKLECAYSPAGEGAGTMTLHNPTSKPMNRGIPVIYRLSSSGEQFTTHLKAAAGPNQSTTVEHRHAGAAHCEAWTYLR